VKANSSTPPGEVTILVSQKGLARLKYRARTKEITGLGLAGWAKTFQAPLILGWLQAAATSAAIGLLGVKGWPPRGGSRMRPLQQGFNLSVASLQALS